MNTVRRQRGEGIERPGLDQTGKRSARREYGHQRLGQGLVESGVVQSFGYGLVEAGECNPNRRR